MSDAPAATKLILIADDDPDVLELLRFRLNQEGYETAIATNGEEALALVRERSPDACILDVRMPKLDGLSVVRAMREDDGSSEIPVLLLTASVADRNVARGLDAGANDYMAKPFAHDELKKRVAALLRGE
jgi:two-component system phosphate regulon response regulator PhoB